VEPGGEGEETACTRGRIMGRSRNGVTRRVEGQRKGVWKGQNKGGNVLAGVVSPQG